MADTLNMGYINSLPQPFVGHVFGGDQWQVDAIDVQTGLVRVNVVGMLQAIHISEFRCFVDAGGNEHAPDDFYADAQPAQGEGEK